MSSSDSNPDLLEEILEDFVTRLRRGESPTIASYEQAHPQYAAEIRAFFPAALAVEQIALQRQQRETPPVAVAAPERLGDFRIIREIGRGGMGIVYEAEQQSLGRHVAVKVLPQTALLHPQGLGRFQREAQTAAQLHHTNIVPVFGVGESQGCHYIVMQLIDGVGLDEVLRALVPGQTPKLPPSLPTTLAMPPTATNGTVRLRSRIPPRPPSSALATTIAGQLFGEPSRTAQSVARIGVQAAQALHYAHQRGTLHRDIKPANLLVDHQGTVWITDFGLAKAVEQDQASQTGDLVGTLRYLPPERLHGTADTRSDIYSLGLTLYELLTQRPAYEQSSPSVLLRRIAQDPPVRPRTLNPLIPRDLETIVLKATAREPQHRYATAEQLSDDLTRFLEDRPIQARRLNAAERLWRWARRNRAVASLLGLAAALLVVVAVVTSVGYVRTSRANAQVREALAGQSQQREKAEALSRLTLEALDGIFQQYVPNRVSGASELALGEGEGAAVRMPAEAALTAGTAALLERLLVFYDRLAQQNVAQAELRRKVADANRRVGDIHRRLGHVEQAQAAYQKAIASYQRETPDATPADRVADAVEMARIYNELGDMQWAARTPGEGYALHAQAMQILEAAAIGASPAARRQYELARTHYFLGRGAPPTAAPGRGPNDDAQRRPRRDREAEPAPRRDEEPHLRSAIQILERLLAEQPGDAEYRHLLACCYRDLPTHASAERAIEILQKLVADFPAVPDYRFDLSKTYAKVDLRSPETGGAATAAWEQRLRKSLALSEQLRTESPNVPEYTAAYVQGLYTLTELLRRQRHPDEAETTLRKALTLQTTLVEQFPKVNAYVVWKAILQESLAKLLADRRRTDEARTLLESAVASLEPLVKADPQGMAYARDVLGRCYRNLSGVYEQMGQPQRAEEMLRRGRDLPRK